MKMDSKGLMAYRIKELRMDLGLTQRELADEIGLSYGSIVDYENGRREPNSKAMVALERYFGVSGEYLRGEVGKETFMENSKAIQGELDLTYNALTRFMEKYTVSNQDEQILAATALTKSIDLIAQHLLLRNQPVEVSFEEIMGPFIAIFQLNAFGRAELNKRADELQQLAQYRK